MEYGRLKRAIGVDAGGSRTLAILVDEHGSVVARARSGGANPRSVGPAFAVASLREALLPLLSLGNVVAVCIGAAGAGRESDREFFRAELTKLLPAETMLLVRSDGQIALRAGTPQRPALVVIAGTGSLVYGERPDGEGIRCGGYGALIGDSGSAYAIGLAAIHHAALVLDRAEPSSKLSTSVLETIGAQSTNELIERIHHWPPDVGAIAALATAVGGASAEGDFEAKRIVAAACDELAQQVRAVALQIRTPDELPVVASGGAFDAVPELLEAVRAGAEGTGAASLCRLALEPVHGAAQLALELMKGFQAE